MRLMSKAKKGSLLRVLDEHWVYRTRELVGWKAGDSVFIQKNTSLVFLERDNDLGSGWVRCLTETGIFWVNPEFVTLVMT